MKDSIHKPLSTKSKTYFVGIHANAQRGPYYFDVAISSSVLQKNINRMIGTFFRDGEIKLEDVYYLIWHEECESEAAAWARVDETRVLPRAHPHAA
jgi:hypothetical protein